MKTHFKNSKQTKACLVSLATLLMAAPSFAQTVDKRAPQRMAFKATAPCVNPDAPCPGAPVIMKISSMKKMGARDTQADLTRRLISNFPKAEKEVLAQAAREMTLIGQQMGEDYPDAEIQALAGGCCTVTVTVKITFGKK